MRRFRDKIVSKKGIAQIAKGLKKKGKRIVFTNGCFDIIHYGHIYYLERAALLGDALVVGVNSDASIKRLKGESRPVNPLKDRMAVIAALEAVDYVVAFGEDTPYSLIKAVAPDVLVKGGDWKEKDIVGADVVIANGGKVVTIPLRKGRSTTGIIERARGRRNV